MERQTFEETIDSTAVSQEEPQLDTTCRSSSIPSETSTRLDERQRCVRMLIDSALTSVPREDHEIQRERQYLSSKLEQAFGVAMDPDACFSSPPSIVPPRHLLDYFVAHYFKNFQPLWPLFFESSFDPCSILPTLYLTVAAIGSTYAGKSANAFGRMLLESLQAVLITRPLDPRQPNGTSEAICQTLLLNQVMCLYLGQRRSLFIAQQLGGILVIQAHRMDLFNEALVPAKSAADSTTASSTSRMARAYQDIKLETRRWLGFGILRAETYLCTILMTRPLVSFEEFNLRLLKPEKHWVTKTLKSWANAQEENGNVDVDGRTTLLFSDLVRIALDPDETLPVLRPIDYELLLIALQQELWRFGQDRYVLERITGDAELSLGAICDDLRGPDNPFKCERLRISPSHSELDSATAATPPNSSKPPTTTAECAPLRRDHLSFPSRRMNDFRRGFHRCVAALQKWMTSLATIRDSDAYHTERSRIFSCRILFHLTCVRLFADVNALHTIAHSKQWPTCRQEISQQDTISRIHRWYASRDAALALENACEIYELVAGEQAMPPFRRARFNLFAVSKCYHHEYQKVVSIPYN
jgi:hypothetical protein